MHDIKAIRDNPEAFDAGLKRRGMAPLAAEILALDQERRRLVQVAEELQGQRNSISREIGKLKAAGDDHKRVFDLLAAAERQAIADPRAWITAQLGGKSDKAAGYRNGFVELVVTGEL